MPAPEVMIVDDSFGVVVDGESLCRKGLAAMEAFEAWDGAESLGEMEAIRPEPKGNSGFNMVSAGRIGAKRGNEHRETPSEPQALRSFLRRKPPYSLQFAISFVTLTTASLL